jgi:hypothetical protein
MVYHRIRPIIIFQDAEELFWFLDQYVRELFLFLDGCLVTRGCKVVTFVSYYQYLRKISTYIVKPRWKLCGCVLYCSFNNFTWLKMYKTKNGRKILSHYFTASDRDINFIILECNQIYSGVCYRGRSFLSLFFWDVDKSEQIGC